MSQIPDDSALIHGRSAYDPVKARAYYLRTRQLKGRQPGKGESSGGRRPAGRPAQTSKGRSPAAARQARAEQKAALERRLDRLQEVLRSLVDAAKKRSGVEDKTKKDKTSTAKESSKKEKTEDKKLTAAQKREKAKADKERYEKEHQSVSSEISELQDKIKSVQDDIREALAEARKKRPVKSSTPTASKGR